MSERFTRLFAAERNLYAEGCPLVVEGAALLKDNEKGNLIAQLKFNNITNNTIKSIAIKLKLFDNAGRELDKSTEYTYLDISLSRDNTYGDKVPVPVLSLQARSFQICIAEVVFKDNSIYQSESFDLKSIKEPQMLSSYFDNTDLEEQYSLECDTDARYIPTKDRDLWICTCGEVNRENETCCHICGCSFEKSLKKLDKAKLEENFEARMKENVYTLSLKQLESNNISELKEAHKNFTELGEYKASKEKAEECKIKIEKLEAELAKTRKRNKKIAIISLAALPVVICISVLVNNVIIPNNNYNNAVALMNEGKYEEAIFAFNAMNGYKDSNEKARAVYDKYKEEKLKSAQTGDYIYYGSYEQDNNTANGKEDIEWLVLEVKDGNALVISKYALDCEPYNTKYESVTWETCTLRSWLNNEFINNAFSEEEKSLIPTVTIEAHKNPEYDTNQGNATQDQVFLLSRTEVNKYFSSDIARQCQPTDYADANGVDVNDNNGNCWWWLRSPGDAQDYAASVSIGGYVYEYGYNVDIYIAVRPALWIEIK